MKQHIWMQMVFCQLMKLWFKFHGMRINSSINNRFFWQGCWRLF